MNSNELEEAVAYRFVALAIEAGFAISVEVGGEDGIRFLADSRDPDAVFRMIFRGHQARLRLKSGKLSKATVVFTAGVGVEVVECRDRRIEAVLDDMFKFVGKED